MIRAHVFNYKCSEQQACVSYRPAWGESHAPPAKKRKHSERMKDGSIATSDSQLPKLFDGRESEEFVSARLAAFTHLWAAKHIELEVRCPSFAIDAALTYAFVACSR
jgi:hypothetical protein